MKIKIQRQNIKFDVILTLRLKSWTDTEKFNPNFEKLMSTEIKRIKIGVLFFGLLICIGVPKLLNNRNKQYYSSA